MCLRGSVTSVAGNSSVMTLTSESVISTVMTGVNVISLVMTGITVAM